MVSIPTNYKMGSGLAATIMGQQAGLEAEQQGLANLTAAMRQPQDMVKSEEAMAQMNDPRYIQMKLQNDMAKFGKDTSINEIETAYNNSNRALAHLKAAQAMGPQALQQASMQYLQRMNIDPNSEQGQILLRDPIGNAEKMVQFYSTAATNNPEYLRQYGITEAKGENAIDLANLRGDIQSRLIGQRTAAGGGKPLSMTQYEAQLRQRAGQGDQQAIQELDALEASRLRRTTAGIDARNAPIMNLLQGNKGGAAPAPQAKGGVIKLD